MEEFDIIIIGAGVMGAATAYNLSRTGKNILLIDQFSVENEINASNDYSRNFRYAYAKDTYYTNLAVESLKLWKELEKVSGKQLYVNCGTLILGDHEDSYAMHSYKTLKQLGHNSVLLKSPDLKITFPQFSAEFGLLDKNGGILEASTAVKCLVALSRSNGVHVMENSHVTEIENNSVILESGQKIRCKKLVLACGGWTTKLIDNLPVKNTVQNVFYLEPARVDNFKEDKLPIFGFLEKGFYGFPIHGINAVKIATHPSGETVDIDERNRQVSKKAVNKCKKFLEESIPELANARIVKTKAVTYDMTPDGDFILDKVDNDIVVGCGFSGHGFKFAPVVGRILADLVLKGKTKYDISRFRVDRF